MLIVATDRRFTYFLARADIFKKKFARAILSSFNMIPIFRIRDGWESLDKNKETFQACTAVFEKNGSIVLFPEGNHGGQRRLRPLSRGFTKIAFETLEKKPDSELCIVPVGLNFSDHQVYFSSVNIIYGKPISVKSFSRDPQGANALREALAGSLRDIITHIDPVENYNEKLIALERTGPDYLQPHEVNRRLQNLESTPVHSKRNINIAVKVLSFLIHYICVVPNIIPLLIWSQVKRKVKDPVFVASMRFCTGIVVFPVVYALEIWGVSMIAINVQTLAFACYCVVSMPLFKVTEMWKR